MNANLPTIVDAGRWMVEFQVNGVPKGQQTFQVTAIGAPEARLEESGGAIVLDGRFTPYDFGSVNVGESSRPRLSFAMVNHGSAVLKLGGMSLPEGFQLVDGLPSSLAVGASDRFTIELDSTVAGDFAGQIRVATDDTSEAECNFPVKGTVVGAFPALQLPSPCPRRHRVGRQRSP